MSFEGISALIVVFSGVLGRFQPFSAPKIAEITRFMHFSDKPNVKPFEPRQNCQKGATVGFPMIARGSVIRPIVVALHNPNLREPEEDQRSSQRSSHNGTKTGQKIFVAPQYQPVQEPVLPSVSLVCFI